MSHPNRLRSNKWKFNISNVPLIGKHSIKMETISENCRGFSMPSLSVSSFETVNFMNNVSFESMSRNNDGLEPFIVEFILSENMENYMYFFRWIRQLRSGVTPNNSIKKNVIEFAWLDFLDNQDRVVSTIKFEKLLPEILGALQMTQGVSNEISFTVSLKYHMLGVVDED